MKTDEDYLHETEMRKAQNYNHRMDAWNEIRGENPKTNDRAFGCGIAFILIIMIGTLIIAIVERFAN